VRRTLTVVVLLSLVAAGCASARSTTTASGKDKVVAAFFPVAAAAQRVGGRCVSVTNLTPAGAEPHDLELIPDQVDEIQDAKVVFVMGHGFQPAVERAADQRDGPTVHLLDRLGIDSAGKRVAPEDPTKPVPVSSLDPHVWLDPVLYSKLVDAVRAELVKVDPKCRDTFERNAVTYKNEIAAVGAAYAVGLRDCKRRTIVTAHEAFGYLAQQYGLRQEGIAGIAPDEEPNAQRIADLADLVRKDRITTIFTEELVSPKVADALAREAGGVKTETLNPLESLSDHESSRGEDWASVMRTNLAKIRRALGCRVAATPGS
jgi:zinc transport system substrate-binding protein